MVAIMMPLWVDNGQGPARNPDLSGADFAILLQEWRAGLTQILWQAAHDYEYAQISGTGVALLAVGVVKGGPVAASIQAWCQTIWTLYYQRKPDVSAWTAPGQMDMALFDFSSCGNIPHSMPDLMAELGIA